MGQQMHVQEGRVDVFSHFVMPERFAVGMRFQDGTKFFQLWPIRFMFETDAEDWIKFNYPREQYSGMEWCIVQVDEDHV